MDLNADFRDLFAELNDAGADFLVVGAYAVMAHTEPRYTKDLDVWVRPEASNAERVHAALTAFGAGVANLSVGDLAEPGVFFMMGLPPNRIDVLTAIDGVEFGEAWSRRVESRYGDQPVNLLSVEDLIRNKLTVGRPQDLIDVEKLEAAQ